MNVEISDGIIRDAIEASVKHQVEEYFRKNPKEIEARVIIDVSKKINEKMSDGFMKKMVQEVGKTKIAEKASSLICDTIIDALKNSED